MATQTFRGGASGGQIPHTTIKKAGLWIVFGILGFLCLIGIAIGAVYYRMHKKNNQESIVATMTIDKSATSFKTTVINMAGWSDKMELNADRGEQIVYVPCVGGVQCVALINEKYEMEFPLKQGQVGQNNTADKSYTHEKVKSIRWKVRDGQPIRPVKIAWCTFYGDIAPQNWYTKAVEGSYYATN